MFDKLFRRPAAVQREADRVWKTQAAALEGLLTLVTALPPATTRVLLVAHFADTAHALEAVCAARGLACERYFTPLDGARLHTPAAYQPANRLHLALAEALPRTRLAPGQDWGFELHLHVVEHHPLPAPDDQLLAFAAGLPGRTRVGFHASLESPLLQHYGGQQVIQLMNALHVPEHESLANPLIERSIRQAQEKVARQVPQPAPARSMAQWFQVNLPPAG